MTKSIVLILLAALMLGTRNTRAGEALLIIGKDNEGKQIVPKPIVVEAGQVFKTTYKRAFGFSNVSQSTALTTRDFRFTYVSEMFRMEGSLYDLDVLPGPGVLTIDVWDEQRFSELWGKNSGMVLGYQITPVQVSPESTLIIPANSPGGTISLEMSSDLTNWTPATLGTYSSPVSHLFFRMKLEGQQ